MGIALGLAVSLMGLSGAINPFVHSTCRGQPVQTEQLQMLEALVNAPYRGVGSVNSTWENSLSLFTQGEGFPGVGVANGSVAAAFIQVNVTIILLSNSTAPGLGPNERCTNQFQVELPMQTSGGTYIGGIFDYSWEPLFGPRELSDRLEPRMVNLTTYLGDASPLFSNGFQSANSASIHTCGGPPQPTHVESNYLTVWIPFEFGAQNHTAPVVLPYNQSFNYWFPSNGTWAVDNLSEPGGPGGGWAFDYLGPCA